MNLRIRLNRSPDAEGGGGVAVIEKPETAAPEAAEPQEQTTTSEAKAEGEEGKAPDAKPTLTDWEAYQKMQEKFRKRPDARVTKAELALQAKYEGKDESAIEGYTRQDQPQGEEESPAAQDPAEKKPDAAALPEALKTLIGDKSPVGAKTLEDLPQKVTGLVNEIKKLNGERGAVGRVLESMGAKNLEEASVYVKNAAGLDRLVKDLKAGRPEAFEFIGAQRGAPADQGAQGRHGDIPDGILDEGLYKTFHPEIQSLKQENAELKRVVQERLADVEAWRKAEERRVREESRNQGLNDIVAEVSTLASQVQGLWDPKQGSLNQALTEYYNSDPDAPYHPGLKAIVEVLDIGRKHNIQDLSIAYSHWARVNQAQLLKQAQDKAREPFLGKNPSVGLSDQRGSNSGQFKEYTKTQVLNMGRQGYPAIPPEWVDETGTILMNKVPPYARQWLHPEDNEE